MSEETESRVPELEAPLLEQAPKESIIEEALEEGEGELEEAELPVETPEVCVTIEETPACEELE